MSLEAINRFEIARFKRPLLSHRMMESTVNRYLAVISQLFHKAVEWDWLFKIKNWTFVLILPANVVLVLTEKRIALSSAFTIRNHSEL
jgi:hypothetical protein